MIPATQTEAWARIRQVLGHAQWMVFEHIAANPGCTRNELDRALAAGQPNANYSRRLTELEARGIIRRGPARPCRITGHRSTTWWPIFRDPVEPLKRPKNRAKLLERALKSLGKELAAGTVEQDPRAFAERWRSVLRELEVEAA